MEFVLGLVFLVSILVASSPQQLHHQRSGQQLWWSQYRQPQTTEASLYSDPVDANAPFFRFSNPIHIRPTVIYSQNDGGSRRQELLQGKQFHTETNQNAVDDQLKRKYLFLLGQLSGRQSDDKRSRLIIPMMAGYSSGQTTTVPSQMDSVMARNKNYGPVRDLLSGKQEQNARFFYLDGSNFLSKTVTISVTSTCTSVSIVSCIPLTSLSPSTPPVNCRRRRSFVEIDHTDRDDSQFPVNPTRVQTVMPTVQPILPTDSIQTASIEMTSSKEEIAEPLQTIGNNQLRNGRFVKFNFQSFLTYTTITILKSIVSSTLTQTYLPAAALACLPAGYVVCPV